MKQEIKKIVESAIIKYQQKNRTQDLGVSKFNIEYPKASKFGDYSCNVAMQLAPVLHTNPMGIANELALYIDDKYFEKIDVAPPGFINFYLKKKYLAKRVAGILETKTKYGKTDLGQGKKAQVEFISANPTGPLHLGNGRGGFFGDCLANVLSFADYKVKREYILNDRGKQVDTLGESVIRRYLQEQGIKVDYPDELYKGDYIKDLAKKVKLKDFKSNQSEEIEKVKGEVKEWALKEMVKDIERVTAEKCNIKFDRMFSEKSLYKGKLREEVWNYFFEKNLFYKKDEAWWFKASQFGDEKDRVVVKENEQPTYFFSDILYLADRFEKRKFDKVIMVWGCDHHGDVTRVQAAAEVLGHKGKLDIVLYQLVRLMFNGKELRMSKRKGTFVTLEELVDEVGLDVVRWFFIMYQVGSHMDFDLNLAKKKSEQNPVYYVQYAHARICSILNKISKSKLEESKNIEYSNHSEVELIKELIKFPDLVEEVAETYEVHKIPQYTLDIARKFHKFYSECRVINDDQVNIARLNLTKATKIVIANSLKLMGISAPTKM